MSESTMLVEIESLQSTDLFVIGGTDDVVSRIEKEARSVLHDVTTPKGRKAIASNAAKVARSKTYLDGLGKELVAGLKQQTKAVDQERRKMRERLDALKIEIRKPLSDFEDMEQARVEGLKSRLVKVESMDAGLEFASVKDIEKRVDEIRAFQVDQSDWMEFHGAALVAKHTVLGRARRQLVIAKEREEALRIAEAARKEAEEKQRQVEAKARRDREERIRVKAAEKARLMAENAASAEKARVASLQRRLDGVRSMGWDLGWETISDMKRKIESIKTIEIDDSWQEFATDAVREKNRVLDLAGHELAAKIARADSERAAKEADLKLAREKLEREETEKAAKDAANKATADAKRKLNAEKARREQAANKAREKLAREKLKREEAEKAAIDAKARLEAAEKEKELQAAQKRKAEAEKDANRANAEIEALNSLNAVVGPERAEVLLRSIILGNIRHVRFEP